MDSLDIDSYIYIGILSPHLQVW